MSCRGSGDFDLSYGAFLLQGQRFKTISDLVAFYLSVSGFITLRRQF